MNNVQYYRAKGVNDTTWSYGIVVSYRRRYDQDTSVHYGLYKNNVTLNAVLDIQPETICRKTGLKDKNGNDIYEGDILLFECGYKFYYEVFFQDGAFCYYENVKTKTVRSFKDFLLSTQCEIIGNKFDNPELLELCWVRRN